MVRYGLNGHTIKKQKYHANLNMMIAGELHWKMGFL
jgi:hypothetical protein